MAWILTLKESLGKTVSLRYRHSFLKRWAEEWRGLLYGAPLQTVSVILLTAMLTHLTVIVVLGRAVSYMESGWHIMLACLGLLGVTSRGSWRTVRRRSVIMGFLDRSKGD